MGSGDKRKPDTLDAIASARTMPSGDIDPLSSADTMLAPEASVSHPRLPQSGGEVLGNRYEILGELGRGGEGVVYRARDLKADAIVALKLLQQDEGSQGRLKRFRRELRMARKVTHPNVVRIHDLIELPGRFGLSMELVEGEPLDARLERGPLTRDELVRLAVDLARALAAAHEAGVTHRDLKPANVLLRKGSGHAVVTDFGVSRAHGILAEQAGPLTKDLTPLNLTREGTLIGTPQYMAPEQLEGRIDIGPAADVYAYGLVMYEAATGIRPHASGTFSELRRKRNGEAVPPLRTKRPDLPRPLCDAVDRALQPDPAARFAGGPALLATVEPLITPVRRRLAPVWLALGIVAAGGGGVLALSRRTPSPPPPPRSTAPAPPRTPALAMHVSNVRRITSGDGCEEFPHFTPDGRSVVYDGTVGRDSFIYLLDVAPGSTPRQLTHVQGWDIAPSVSPDGKQLAFVRFEGEKVAAFVAPLDGSAPPHLVVRGAVRPSWTRDGKAIWAGSDAPLAAYDATTGTLVRELKGSPPSHTAQTVELKDGSVVTLLPFGNTAGKAAGGVAVFPPDGPMRWLMQGAFHEVLAVTADERHALVVQTGATTSLELLDVPVDGSPSTSLAATGINARKGLTLSPDHRQVAWSACGDVPQIVGFDAAGRVRKVVETVVADPSALVGVPGTQQVVVVSSNSGKAEPLLVGLASDALPEPIPVGALEVQDVAVSHDGTRFVAAAADGLYVGSLHGVGELRRLTQDAGDDAPAFRAGDKQIVFTRHPHGEPFRVMMVAVDGGEPTPLLDDDSDWAAPAPFDDRIVYLAGATSADTLPKLWDGHSSRPLSDHLLAGRYGGPRFSPDGRRVAMVRGDTELIEVDVATGAIVRTLSTQTGDQLVYPTYTPAGLVAIRVRFQGNVWIADAAF